MAHPSAGDEGHTARDWSSCATTVITNDANSLLMVSECTCIPVCEWYWGCHTHVSANECHKIGMSRGCQWVACYRIQLPRHHATTVISLYVSLSLPQSLTLPLSLFHPPTPSPSLSRAHSICLVAQPVVVFPVASVASTHPDGSHMFTGTSLFPSQSTIAG